MKWQITLASFCLAVVFNSGCAQNADTPEIKVRDHVAVSPTVLEGPLDQSLPKYGAAKDVWISSDGVSRVAIVWERGTNHARLRSGWEQVANEPQNAPVPRPPEANTNDAWICYSGMGYAPGKLVGAAVITPNGVECRDFLPNIGSGLHSSDDLICGLHYVGDSWRLMFAMGWQNGSKTPLQGLCAVPLEEDGFGDAYKFMPNLTDSHGIWTHVDQNGTHVFWITKYAPPFEFVMHGDQLRDRLNYACIKAPSDLAESPVRRLEDLYGGRIRPMIVSCGDGSFDFFYERDITPPRGDVSKYFDKDHIWHSRDVASKWSRGHRRVACYEHFCNKLHILPLPDDKIQLVWFEESIDKQGGKCSRLMEAHFAGGRWSKKRQLFESTTWQGTTLATTPIRLGGQDGVIAIWQDDDERLTYSLGFPCGTWSQPKTFDLKIGEASWLAPCGDRIALVTRIDGNLYWCFFHLRPEETMDGGPGLASGAAGR